MTLKQMKAKDTVKMSNQRKPKRYGLLHFAFDAFLTFITSGFWLIWIFVREMRREK
ncbi:hypothetical protein NXS08_01270 [Gleimia sp. 6138-11-ORH1]|uniref:hypothetical protein n=1 Tax=Gleimia sp. 6138-11-ORH1 TaxID=2973937 RepID=UPI00216A26C9|nr:hypothetical protein [Gleimia sp. 6138-11-ORH1]MCS4484123.1 hypothetical protein [Gleimia sp. 6138-11-ORH1]